MQQSNIPIDPERSGPFSKQSVTLSVKKKKRKKQQDVREVTIYIHFNTYLMVMDAFYGLASCATAFRVLKFFHCVHQVFRQLEYYLVFH